ncbi:site-specific integrase [Actinoplanes sp. NBC_00393]|uniref:tyrosine-type recombinase/integrase n=1 Tax=Actinoplanes sp. NBC_00393 TaxID=2975953 RepID=UPI002E1D2DA5
MTVPAESSAAASIATITALLNHLGITPEQLLDQTSGPKPEPPTFDQYIPQVAAAVSPGTRRLYETYWRRVREKWGNRRIDEPSPLEIRQLAEEVRSTVVARRNARGGRSAAEHLIAALRCLYRYAAADRLIDKSKNPAARVAKPRRQASTRRALPDKGLAQIIEVAASTGNDPDLDSLILRLHIETACRRAGALAIQRSDLDVEQCLVRLHEKGETIRWQPISPSLTAALVAHFAQRGDGQTEGQLLRYRNGQPITRRRYDYLWQRIGKHLPWVATQQISTHWLRHTTLTWVERQFGYAIARAYAGHSGRSDAGTTSSYIKADVEEVAVALSTLSREAHPLALSQRDRSRQ